MNYSCLLNIIMSIDRRKATLFGAAAAVRLLLFTGFPGLPDLLTARVEISTPVTSFKRCELHLICRCSKLTPDSTRRSLPLQSQCLPLRWRGLPPSPFTPDPLLAPPQLLFIPNLYIHVIHSSGSAKRKCSYEDCRVWGGWVFEAVHITEEGQEME